MLDMFIRGGVWLKAMLESSAAAHKMFIYVLER